MLATSTTVNLKMDNESKTQTYKGTNYRVQTKVIPLFLLLRMKFVEVLCLLCFVFTSVSGREQQKFAIEPQDQTAVLGARVTLPCRVENKVGQLQWTKDDFGLGTHRHLAGYDRYRMIGSDEEGDYSLDIREVTLDDDAQYQCQVSSGPRGEPPIRSRYARLLVLVPPEPPRILQGPLMQTIEERDVSLECVSVGGKPAAEITWVDSDGGVLTQGVTYTIEPMADGRRYTARSVLSLRPRRHHHNQTFICQAQNTADRAYKAASIKLEVKYAPKVRVQIRTVGAKSSVQEGDTLRVGCVASANPNDLEYRWFINNDRIVGNFTNELIIRNVSRKFNEGLIKCEVFNSVGKSADSKTLEVTYGPSFLIRPEDVETEEGSMVTLHCLVDGHPQPDVVWLHHEKDRIVRTGKSPNLTIAVTEQSAGQYWCRAKVPGYKEIEAYATVYVKGPPKIQSNRTQYGVEGDSVKVDCISFSVPKPDYVIWSFAGVKISPYDNQEYALLEETMDHGMKRSTLIIRESEPKHFGLYNCTVANLYGTDTVQIHLIPDKSFPLIMIISGGASSAILVLIIMLIIMLCHRRRRKSIPGDFDKKPDLTDITKDKLKDSDRHSNISDLKMELRQVDGSCDLDPPSISETEFHTNMASSLALPLAGPVPLGGFENELMKQYQRYSQDFGEPGSKNQTQSNGYIPYVDYTRDYVPPSVHADSPSNSLTRSVDTGSTVPYLGHSHGSLQRLGQSCGPDVIPMNPVCMSGIDVRYAATYGNPYLRIGGGISFSPHMSASSTVAPAPPPYYSVKSPNLPMPPVTSSSSLSSSRSMPSPQGSASSGAQPQVPKSSPPTPGALYILPPTSQGCGQSQITAKGNTKQGTSGTHV